MLYKWAIAPPTQQAIALYCHRCDRPSHGRSPIILQQVRSRHLNQ
ncbi:MAG: hypothetical protein AB4352_12515 [Hormoscilla sp.]